MVFSHFNKKFQDVHGYVSTGQEGSKFGIPGEELDDVLEMAVKSERIRVVGLHCHIGSTLTDSHKFRLVLCVVFFFLQLICFGFLGRFKMHKGTFYRQSTQVLVDLYQKIQKKFPEMQILNLGGGLSIPYKAQVFILTMIKKCPFLKLRNLFLPNVLYKILIFPNMQNFYMTINVIYKFCILKIIKVLSYTNFAY